MRRTPAALVICTLVFVASVAGCTSTTHRTANALSGYGWGSDSFGQLGIPSNGQSRSPVAVELPTGTSTVALGRDFTLALVGSQVYSWGHDEVGQLGDGHRTDRFTAARIAGLRDVTAIAAGTHYGMALTSDGVVYTWGEGIDGQLGNGSAGPQPRPRKLAMPAGAQIAQIVAGSANAVAIARSGDLYAWGRGSNGELGIGSTKSAPKPTKVLVPEGVDVRQVSIGDRHTVAVTDTHEVLGWGSNADDRLGLGSRGDVVRPTRVPAGGAVDEVAAEAFATLLRRSDGAVLAAGRNKHGELGDGTTAARSHFVKVDLPDGFRAGSVAAGPGQGFAVSADSESIVAWGDGVDGRLGTGGSEIVSRPTPIRLAVGHGVDPARSAPHFVGVAPGSYATIALVERGPLDRLVAVGPAGPVAAGAPQRIIARGYDSAGNDLGQPDDVHASMAGGSCSGLVCTANSPGLQSIEVRAGDHEATAVLQAVPARLLPRSASASPARATSAPPSASTAAAASDEDSSPRTVLGVIAIAVALAVLIAAVVVYLPRRRTRDGDHLS